MDEEIVAFRNEVAMLLRGGGSEGPARFLPRCERGQFGCSRPCESEACPTRRLRGRWVSRPSR
jgi:hypothetical protein